jgi:hypothetical protein
VGSPAPPAVGPRQPAARKLPADYVASEGPETPDGCRSGFYVSAEPFDPATALPVTLDPVERSLVESTVANGPTQVSSYAYDPPLPGGSYVEHEGRFYRLGVRRVGSTEVAAWLVDLTWEDGQTAPQDATRFDYADLPLVDQRALRLAIYGPRYGSEGETEERHPSESLEVHEYPAPYPDGADDSRLVGVGTVWVRWNDRIYRVAVGGEATNMRHTFRVETTAVAHDDEAFRGHVRQQYLVDRAGVSDGERKILDQATGGTYEECEPTSSALSSLRERLGDDDTLPQPRDSAWLVGYDGDRYSLEITNWVH